MICAKIRKHLSKRAVLKLKPGTFIRIMWDDAPDEVVLLLKRPDRDYGSMMYMKDNGAIDSHADYRQVVSVAGSISWSSEHEPETEGTSEIFNAHVGLKNEYDEETRAALIGRSP